jgi:hypothetical protein
MPAKKKTAKAKVDGRQVPVEITKEQMEQWHKSVARAGGYIALTLARRRRAPDFVETLLLLLSPVVDQLGRFK